MVWCGSVHVTCPWWGCGKVCSGGTCRVVVGCNGGMVWWDVAVTWHGKAGQAEA